ncbi:uncharacterized protein RCC_02048 [Ramularia collo-cygni]|uniref:Uncharacterized protein n=1 Tax=Ramularia collo-cygni TaxID=112498 RepID=A0A2D3UYE9_9PEZI|nr:uncharacterized protein RCC_02048 [Ramularia collo-cygni]CZT16206.1 uncharacterized protein RCC_02048 [Ramularia collo-cygni]
MSRATRRFNLPGAFLPEKHVGYLHDWGDWDQLLNSDEWINAMLKSSPLLPKLESLVSHPLDLPSEDMLLSSSGYEIDPRLRRSVPDWRLIGHVSGDDLLNTIPPSRSWKTWQRYHRPVGSPLWSLLCLQGSDCTPRWRTVPLAGYWSKAFTL